MNRSSRRLSTREYVGVAKARACEEYFEILNPGVVYSNAHDTPGKQVLLLVDSDPGQVQVEMLARLWLKVIFIDSVYAIVADLEV